jgi:hypothetical protein
MRRSQAANSSAPAWIIAGVISVLSSTSAMRLSLSFDERGADHSAALSGLFDEFDTPAIAATVPANIFRERHTLAFGKFVALIDQLTGVRVDVSVAIIRNNKAPVIPPPFHGPQHWRLSSRDHD